MQNDIENVYMAFALFWASFIAMGYSTDPSTVVHIIGVAGFTVLRCSHTFIYAKLKKQVPRTLCYVLGQVCLIILCVNALISVL